MRMRRAVRSHRRTITVRRTGAVMVTGGRRSSDGTAERRRGQSHWRRLGHHVRCKGAVGCVGGTETAIGVEECLRCHRTGRTGRVTTEAACWTTCRWRTVDGGDDKVHGGRWLAADGWLLLLIVLGGMFVADAQIERLLGWTVVRHMGSVLRVALAGRRFGFDVVQEGRTEGNGGGCSGGCVRGIGIEVRLHGGGGYGVVGVRRHWVEGRVWQGFEGYGGGVGIVLGLMWLVGIV